MARFAARLAAAWVVASLLVGVRPASAEEATWSECVQRAGMKVFRVEGTCNTYVVTHEKTRRFVVVDPCPEAVAFVRTHQAGGHELEAVWITHEHGDHLAGLAPLRKAIPFRAYGHARTRAYVDEVAKKGEWPWKDESGTPLPAPQRLDETLEDGDAVTVGTSTWKVLHVPGHSPGSLAFLLEGELAIVGDVLFEGSVGRTDLPTSDAEVFARTLSEKLWDLPEDVNVLPGHGPTTKVGEEKATNWLFEDLVRKARGLPPRDRPRIGIRFDRAYEGDGVRLAEVVADGPAATAGLRVGDVIRKADGVEVQTVKDFVKAFLRHGVGDRMRFVLEREGETLTIEVELGKRPPL